MNEFKVWLEGEMNARAWSISDLARYANVARGSVGNVLRGERNPGPELCEAIARAFKIPPDVVFRKAGILPQAPQVDDTSQEILHIATMLDKPNKKDLLEYARLRLKLQGGKGDADHPRTRPPAAAPG